MNYKQRIVLIIGAAVFLYALFTSPKVSVIKGTYVIPSPDKKEIAKIVDVSTAITRAVAIFGATLLVFIALKGKAGPRIQSIMDRNPIPGAHCQESGRELIKKNVIAKIIKFLKDFF